jgi:drug/metabolite transporter (DMT)-like permease
MNWLPLAIVTTLALATADVCVKLAAGKLSNSVGMLVYGTCTFVCGAGWFLWQRLSGETQYAQWPGVWASLGVGVAFSIVTIGLYATFGLGAPISVASPVIRLGGLVAASLVGLWLFREPFSWRYALGIVLAVAGIYLIITR